MLTIEPRNRPPDLEDRSAILSSVFLSTFAYWRPRLFVAAQGSGVMIHQATTLASPNYAPGRSRWHGIFALWVASFVPALALAQAPASPIVPEKSAVAPAGETSVAPPNATAAPTTS